MMKVDHISWDEYFMGIALLSSQRSKDPHTKVGACLSDSNHKVISIGYNGMPSQLDESKLSWNIGDGLDSKYLYVCHAELNAILNAISISALKDSVLYVTLFPCNECAKAIIQAGVKEVVYLDNKYASHTETKASQLLFKLAGIKTREYKERNIKLQFER